MDPVGILLHRGDLGGEVMMRLALTFLVAISLWTGTRNVQAEELVTALSSEMVSIQSNFTGTNIVVFGQVNPKRHPPGEAEGYDLAIVIEGPPEDITTRRKGRFLGVWVNRYYERFSQVPSFYAVASTGDIGTMADRTLLEEHEIGLNFINLAVSGSSDVPLSERDDFRAAFLRLRAVDGLYSEQEASIEFLTDTLFRTTIPLPANIPVGKYKVKSFLLQDGELLSQTEGALSVAKTGFEQYTFELAQNYALVYGLLAVILATFTGWLASVIFRKD